MLTSGKKTNLVLQLYLKSRLWSSLAEDLYQFFKARMLGYVRVGDFYNVIANSLFCWSEAVESGGDERGRSYDWDRGSGLQDNRDGRVFSLPIPSNI